MNIYTAHWRNYKDDLYAPYNRKMFLHKKDADKFLDDLLNFEGIDTYYILEEKVFDQYSPISYIIKSDWECSFGTLHPAKDSCDCDYACDIINEF
jgi:hypothetical protein